MSCLHRETLRRGSKKGNQQDDGLEMKSLIAYCISWWSNQDSESSWRTITCTNMNQVAKVHSSNAFSPELSIDNPILIS